MYSVSFKGLVTEVQTYILLKCCFSKSNQIKFKSNPLFRNVKPRSIKVLVKTCTCVNNGLIALSHLTCSDTADCFSLHDSSMWILMKIVRTGAEEFIDSVDLIQNLCTGQGIYLAQHP